MNDPYTKNHRPLLEGRSQAWQLRLLHQVQKKGWKWWPSCRWRTFHWREEAIEHDGCNRCFEQWSKSKKMDGNGDRVVNDKHFINERKPSSTSAVKGVLNKGDHRLIPVTAKVIPPQPKNWHNRTIVLYTKYIRNNKNYFPLEQKN